MPGMKIFGDGKSTTPITPIILMPKCQATIKESDGEVSTALLQLGKTDNLLRRPIVVRLQTQALEMELAPKWDLPFYLILLHYMASGQKTTSLHSMDELEANLPLLTFSIFFVTHFCEWMSRA
ncbi:hypothetical protein Y1Q_0004569 [Alligator mississippiensis]|uniref:Uncharacterized protein n=1 Tax=Alligator mississippiensis TaxID=8496 RepID=A0A151MHG2_ALLMI|nr:hypothetical protein Y1Q_0004569 [Alligator mississippiensis]